VEFPQIDARCYNGTLLSAGNFLAAADNFIIADCLSMSRKRRNISAVNPV